MVIGKVLRFRAVLQGFPPFAMNQWNSFVLSMVAILFVINLYCANLG